MNLSIEQIKFFYASIQQFLDSEQIRRMDSFVQHGDTSCLQHSIAVAYYSFYLCKRLNIVCDYKALIRGAILHDFFLYDWHLSDKSHKWHGFTHPQKALKNAEHYYKLSDVERDIIIKHMWPLTIKLPKYKETFIVCFIDKMCSLFETIGPYCGNQSYSRPLLHIFKKVEPLS